MGLKTKKHPPKHKSTRRGASRPGRWRPGVVGRAESLKKRGQRAVISLSNIVVRPELRGLAIDPRALKQIRQLLTGIEHPGFHRALGDAHDGADLFDRLLVVVDEVYNFSVSG